MKPTETSDSPEVSAIDIRLRAALDPPPDQAQRIARRALTGTGETRARGHRDASPRGRRPWSWAAIAATGLALILLLAPRLLRPRSEVSADQMAGRGSGRVASQVAVQAANGSINRLESPTRLTISNLDGALTVTSPSGSTTVIVSGGTLR